jgi:NRAMP (natural resistance-associated macrophage protein)-like metal ion transporter
MKKSTPISAKSVVKSIIHSKRFGRFLRILGPGLVTGAADDDPSGIATYSQAGATFGFSLLWAFPVLYPLLLAVQESCARIGAIHGKGLAAVIKDNYSRKLLYFAVLLVVVANTINIGADLGAMAASAKLVFGGSYSVYAVGIALLTVILEVTTPYKKYAKVLKWLALTLFAYPITALIVHTPWSDVAHATFSFPHKFDKDLIYLLVGLIGTTISPYLFFWDTSEVVEEEISKHRIYKEGDTPKITKRFLRSIRLDNFVGMTLASVTAWFIVVVCGTVLFKNTGAIQTAADAAKALEPLVHNFPHSGLIAKSIFSFGIIGLGLLAIPVLAGSSSYAISEAFGWKEGLHRKLRKAPGLYGVITLATLVGLAINFLGIDPIKALVFTAVCNAIAAIPLLLLIFFIARNKNIMGEYKSGILSQSLTFLAFLVLLVSSIMLFVGFIRG